MSVLDRKNQSLAFMASDSFDSVTEYVRDLPPWHPLRAVSRGVKHAPRLLSSYVLYRIYKPLTIIVLGMHRSGTSSITRAINLLGARVRRRVRSDCGGKNKHNPKGFWEDGYAKNINKKLLKQSDGKWDNPSSSIDAGVIDKIRMKLFLGSLHGGVDRPAVWKDPRTVLTFSEWKDQLDRYVPVFIFRHPGSVARSLEKRGRSTKEEGIELWVKYNYRLLKIERNEAKSYFIDFDGGKNHINNSLRAISTEPGLCPCSDALSYYDKDLRRSNQSWPMGTRVADIYNELKSRVKKNS